jgi:hypothetical protein
VGDLLSYLCKPTPWCKRVIAIAHNAKGFYAKFILDRAIFLKWTPTLILNGLKIICMTVHHLTFLDFISFLPMALRKLPEAFGLSATKTWYPHYFNTNANLDYVGPIPGIEQYGVAEMTEPERKELISWYDAQMTRSSITDACWNSIARTTSRCCVTRARYFAEISWKSGTSTYF